MAVAQPAVTAEAIVRIWERGRHEQPVDRALTMLAGLSGRAREQLAEVSVERRDRELLELRACIFGGDLTGGACCPHCGCDVEATVGVDQLEPLEERFSLALEDGEVVLRLPTSLDLVAVGACTDAESARHELVRRCVEVAPAGAALLERAEMVELLESELERRAGLSGASVALGCPQCADELELELDVATFCWQEIEVLALRLLRDVDLLARRYGWSEREILALSAARRRAYVELAS